MRKRSRDTDRQCPGPEGPGLAGRNALFEPLSCINHCMHTGTSRFIQKGTPSKILSNVKVNFNLAVQIDT